MKDFFTWDELTRDLAIIAGLGVLMYISANIAPVNIETVSSGSLFEDLSIIIQNKIGGVDAMKSFFLGIEGALALLALVFFAGFICISLRMGDVRRKIHGQYAPIPVEKSEAKGYAMQWQFVLDHTNSENPAEWKIAILEADNMLDRILEDEGYLGETVADRLKAMSPSRIASYDDLWEAHKVRNQIAHGGAIDMDLSKKMVRDTVAKFGNAFNDLGYL